MLIRRIEKFMRVHEMPATKFGRLAANDPRFVLDLRMGRVPRASTEARIRRWMTEYEAALRPAPAPAPQQFSTSEMKELSHAF
ncbi:hypothetical protein [Qipengyuania sp. ASV99]|uniref:hypothetical protein n=1 Tax=Qipengyuania sp. ASV99 TaxID=3399681 RepID=UPI003A4C7E17